MMALDGKAIIKEEITDKDAYDAAAAAAAAAAVATATAVQMPPASSSSSVVTVAGGAASSAAAAAAAAAASTNNNNNNTSSGAAAAISRRLKANSSSSNGDKSSCSSNSSKDSNQSCRERERERERERDRLCRTPPDSPPDSARSLAPRSPHSPLQLHQHQRPQRNASASPVVNGGSGGIGSSGTSPTPGAASLAAAAAAAAAAAHVEQARLVSKMRKFLGALVQFSQELGQPEVSERVRALVLSLCSGTISVEEFRLALQEAINLPLRPYVMPLLKNSVVLMQREVVALARATGQSALQYVTSNEQAVMEFSPHGMASTEFGDIFVQLEAPTSNGGGPSAVFKRRSSDSMMEHGGHNGLHEWSEYMASGGGGNSGLTSSAYPPPSKRLAMHPGHSVVAYDYGAAAAAAAVSDPSYMQRAGDERDMRLSEAQARHPGPPQRITGNPNTNPNIGPAAAAGGGVGGGGEEEWKNIHTMLNCISAMVDKTKRAITILQQRGIEPQHPNSIQEVTPAAMAELRRQTEEKVAEFKRNAEDAVTQVKRQAVIEIQRAVVAAETRAAEIMTQERLRMEKFFMEMSRHSSGERDLDNKSPSITSAAQNGNNLQQQCWNCGRKATETCSGCNMARYCSASCQYRDWDSHHQVCGNSRASELSAKHMHSASSLRSAMATRSPPTPTSAAAAAAAAAHLQAAAAGAREAVASTVAVSGGVPGSAPGERGGGGPGGVGNVGSGGGGAGGGGVTSGGTSVSAATPSVLVANGLGSK